MKNALIIRIAIWFGLTLSILAGHGAIAQDEGALETRYRLGPGDVISIRVFGEADLTFDRIRLSDAATVPYPLLGEIRAQGRTPVELESIVANRLANGYLIDPRVTVSVIEYRQFYVDGEVASPGGFAFQPGMTVRKAISLAGGKTDRAAAEKMFVRREDDPAGEQRGVTLDDKLMPGDILTIEESFF
jgi:polysaccharide export outer membrane protein